MDSEHRLGSEKISKLMLRFAIPGVISMLIMGIYTIIDGIFLGQFEGSYALASINLVMPALGVMMAVSLMLTIGAQAAIGIKLGEGDKKTANRIFNTGAYTLFGLAVVASVFTMFFSDNLARFLGANDTLLAPVTDYLRVIGLFLPFYAGLYYLEAALKVIGYPVLSTVILGSSLLLNIVLDYIFIVELGYGVAGAAYSTGIAFTVGFVFMLYPFLTRKRTLTLFRGKFSFHQLGKICYNGSSEGLVEISVGLATFIFNLAMMRIAGEIGVAAFAAIAYIEFVGIAIFLGITEGVRPIISYNYGAGNFARVKETIRLGGMVSFLTGALLFVLLFFFGKFMMGWFMDISKEQEVVELAILGAKIVAFAFLMNGLNIFAGGLFTSLAKPIESAIISVLRGIVLIALFLPLFPKWFGVTGVWLTIPVAEFITLLVSMIFLKRLFRGWKREVDFPVEAS